ncbi:MAG: alpha/beta hydrolase [Deltaproteobacteria bacterium]|nr:alpha/beta hydrolase [Deltaproteobacteria bacterium]
MRAHSISLRGVVLLGLVAGCTEPSPSMPDASVATSDAPPIADDAAPPPVVLEWGPCPTRFRDECATIAMPIDHDDPSGETIEVMISRRGEGTRQLWLLQGGPGGSAEAFFGLHDFLTTALDPELEVYTIEHRGVGESTRLGCPTAEGRTSPGSYQITREEWPSCQAEVEAEWGERLALFDVSQAAHDLALAIDLTRREGVPVFVYGGSYGTYWANRFGVLHPDQADGLILDAPVAPGADLHLWDLAFEPIGRRVFSDLCLNAPRCREHLGDDPAAFLERVVTALQGGQCGSLGVDWASWRAVFSVFLMDYNLRNWLPALLYRLDRCSPDDQAAIAMLFSQLFGGGGGLPRMSRVLQAHICLAEFWPEGQVDEAPLAVARAENVFFQDGIAHVYAAQPTWPRYDAGAIRNEYAPPSVPMLVLAGSLDPAAPPAEVGYGYRDHLTGPAQTFVEIPYGAHTVLTTGSVGAGMPSCPVQLVRAFFDDPEGTLPVECADDVLPPSFDAPEVLLDRYWGTEDLYD